MTVEVNVNAAYGYDVRGELVGETGTVALNPAAAVRVNAGLKAAEGYAEDWRPRFAEAYRRQDMAWVRAVESGVPAAGAASAWDGYCATLVAEAGVRALGGGAAGGDRGGGGAGAVSVNGRRRGWSGGLSLGRHWYLRWAARSGRCLRREYLGQEDGGGIAGSGSLRG